MGISGTNGALAMFRDVVRSEKLVVAGLRMAELGNQSLRKDVLGVQIPAKKFFEAMGIVHVSIDINGKDGALALDLRQPIARPDLLESFDVVTNFGTLEHVDRQYPAWLNTHRLARTGGLFLHLLPRTGSWPGHCDIRYRDDFVPALAKACGYDVVKLYNHDIDADHRLIAAVLRKTGAAFPTEENFVSRVPIELPTSK